MTRRDILVRAQRLGLHGVTSDGTAYTCHECGEQWRPRSRWLWWPISLHWAKDKRASAWLKRHGIEAGRDRIEQRVFQQVWHFGRLKVVLGRPAPSAEQGRGK